MTSRLKALLSLHICCKNAHIFGYKTNNRIPDNVQRKLSTAKSRCDRRITHYMMQSRSTLQQCWQATHYERQTSMPVSTTRINNVNRVSSLSRAARVDDAYTYRSSTSIHTRTDKYTQTHTETCRDSLRGSRETAYIHLSLPAVHWGETPRRTAVARFHRRLHDNRLDAGRRKRPHPPPAKQRHRPVDHQRRGGRVGRACRVTGGSYQTSSHRRRHHQLPSTRQCDQRDVPPASDQLQRFTRPHRYFAYSTSS